MAFWGRNFIFDSIPSETYSMIISSTDGGDGTSNGSGNVELNTQEIFRRPLPYFYGVQQTPVLEFPVSITTTEMELSAEDAALTQKWLFGQQTYKKLQIQQEDMATSYFNCFLVDPQIIRAGNIIRGFTCTVKCDAPFAWGFEKTISYDYTSFNNNPVGVTVIINNISENLYYTYPIITFTMNTVGGDFAIRNLNDIDPSIPGDNGRSFQFGGLWVDKFGNSFILPHLSPNEVMTVNHGLQTLSSSAGFKRLNSFNKKFFRLLPGYNKLAVVGNIKNLTFKYTPAKRMA
jgi:phage-related protein